MTDPNSNRASMLEEAKSVQKRSLSQPPAMMEMLDVSNNNNDNSNSNSRGSIEKKDTNTANENTEDFKTRVHRIHSLTFDESNKRLLERRGFTPDTSDWLFESLGRGLNTITGWHVAPKLRKSHKLGKTGKNGALGTRTRGSFDNNATNDTQNNNTDNNIGDKTINESETDKIIEEITVGGDCTLRETVFNALNYVLGACILGMPYAMSLSGFCCAFAMASICFSMYVTAHLLDEICSHFSDIGDYTDMVDKILGKNARFAVGMIMCFELYLYVILFFIFAGEILYESGYLQLLNIDITQDSCTVIMVIIILPTTFLSNLKPLAKVSTFGIAAILITFVIVYIEVIRIESENNGSDNGRGLTFYTNFEDFGYGVGSIFACFSVHTVIPSLKGNMENPKDFKRVINIVFTIISIAMITIGLAGYVAYGIDCDEAISSNFNGFYSYFTSILLLIKVWSVPALCLYPVTLIVDNILTCGKKRSKTAENDDEDGSARCKLSFEQIKKYIVRIVLVFVALVIAIVLPSFSFVSNMLGSVCALAMAVLFPCIMYVVWKRRQRMIGKSDALTKQTNIKMILAIGVSISMLFIGLWNIYFLIYFGTDTP